MENNQPTIQNVLTTVQEILTTINEFATNVEERFDRIDVRFDNLETRVTRVEATMVTKEYLDEKMADQKGDAVLLMRKEDSKLKAAVDVLRDKKVFNETDRKKIFKMEPFAELTV